ncbi:MAG: TIGR00725 family protein [Candidatus Altiarchaeia archaeon]
MKTRIGVIGADGVITPAVSRISEKIGRDIAKTGSVLICGGRGGVMEAASRGASLAGGIVVGILPSYDKTEGNAYIDIAITTGMGHSRNSIVVSSSDALIAINGRPGTLSELSLALCMGKPVIAVSGTGGVADVIEEELKKMGIKEKILNAKPADAVKKALGSIK